MALEVAGVTTRPDGASIAFLLVHGFCAAPDEVATLSAHLAEKGIASFAVTVVGHAASSVDIRNTTWRDWTDSVSQGLEVVRSWGMKHLFVAGVSMGGAISTLLASEDTSIDGLVLLAPAMSISGILPRFIPILKYVMKGRVIDVERIQRIYDIKRTKCDFEPLSAYHELFKLQKQARKNLVRITIPTIILHGTEDKTIDPKNGKLAFDGISSEDKELHMIQGAEHVITCHPTRETAFPLIDKFIERITG